MDNKPRMESKKAALNWERLPPIYVLTTHLTIDEQHDIEQILADGGASVTYDIREARIILGNITRPRRALLELQWKGFGIKDHELTGNEEISPSHASLQANKTGHKRRRKNKRPDQDLAEAGMEDSSASSNGNHKRTKVKEAASASGSLSDSDHCHMPLESLAPDLDVAGTEGKVLVVSLRWLYKCIRESRVLPINSYILLEARVEDKMGEESSSSGHVAKGKEGDALSIRSADRRSTTPTLASAILDRAKADARPAIAKMRKRDRINEAAWQDVEGKSFSSSTQGGRLRGQTYGRPRPARLVHQTTSDIDEVSDTELPPKPDWVIGNKIFSCERCTPLETPNDHFIEQLKRIRLARQLTLDEIGVRAYSTSIASLSAYPYLIRSSREILALPGCDQKIAHLFSEYKSNDGRLQAVEEINSDLALKALEEFYQIWGVGATTAREFYYHKGWRDLDDIIEYGWSMLTRVQQIGLKYYDEFLLKIPRKDVEDIAAIVTRHAAAVSDERIQCAIVGGYRRGKPESGDVDVILSHPDEAQTLNVIERVVRALEGEGWITHTLSLHLTTSHRNQQPLPIQSGSGGGFDTLDKALVVWQDPEWPSKSADLSTNPKIKNPNPHRRVDIIISPWRTVGCAVAGWTSGTTFQRDLRRYCKRVKGWKFDSSGVRDRGNGRWLDLEGYTDPKTRCTTWQEAERKVFDGLGLVWREPWERCTG